MSTQSQLLGLPVEFPYGGRVLKIAPITFGFMAAFSDWCYRMATERAERQLELARGRRDPLAEAVYERTMDRVADGLAAGKYEWGGEITRTAMIQQAGIRQMLLMRLKECDPSATMALVDEILKDRDAVRRLKAILFPPDAAGEEVASPPASETTP